MATTIRDKNFFTLVANDIGKSPKLVSTYFDAVVDRIVKEALRGNSISIKNFGFIRPKIYGGKEYNVCGTMKYIEPRLIIKYEMNNKIMSRLNKAELTKEEKRELDILGVSDGEQIPLKKKKRDKRDLGEMFEVIKKEIAEKHQYDTCDESEEDED